MLTLCDPQWGGDRQEEASFGCEFASFRVPGLISRSSFVRTTVTMSTVCHRGSEVSGYLPCAAMEGLLQ